MFNSYLINLMRVYCTYFERRRRKKNIKRVFVILWNIKKGFSACLEIRIESALHSKRENSKKLKIKNFVGKYLFGCIGVDNKFNFRSSTPQKLFFFLLMYF